MGCNNCGDNCGGGDDCGDGCVCQKPPQRINTDRINLTQLGNVVYRNVNKDRLNKFEVVHFELYFLCAECGHTQKFEKDDAPYYAVRFMANYPCISCGNIGGFSNFMVVVSPDKGIELGKDVLSEPQFVGALRSLEIINRCGCSNMGRA